MHCTLSKTRLWYLYLNLSPSQPQKTRCREGGCGRLLHTVNSTLQCLLVSPVFGTVSSLYPTSFLYLSTYFFLHCPGSHSNLLFMSMPAHKIYTKWCLAQLETPAEIVALPSDSYDESLRNKGSNVIEN